MRIVVLGDFHLNEAELAWTEQCMDHIRECEPDLVVPLGDFGSNRLIGGPEGLQQSHKLLSRIGKPLRAILGNHDLQRESGNKGQRHGTMEQELISLFQQPTAYGVIEKDDFRLIFISTDPQPADSCYHVQECYVSEDQFAWLTETLKQRKGVPVIMFTHAPPIGCGLRTVPGVHVRATNAYLDQNHDSTRWLRLMQETPEIVVWFSAHYHLGHGYPDSQTTRWGTSFFITGVHGSATRDGERLSRIMDISEQAIRVMTLDHRQGTILPKADWEFSGTLGDLFGKKQKLLSETVQAPASEVALPTCLKVCPLGDGQPLVNGTTHLGGDRWMVAADDGYVWECDVSSEAVLGTLHLGSAVSGLSSGREQTAYVADNKLYWTTNDDLWRFSREPVDMKSKPYFNLENGATAIAFDGGGLLWIAIGSGLYVANLEKTDNASSAMPQMKLVHTFPEPIARLKADGNRLAASSDDGTLYMLEDGAWRALERRVIGWDLSGMEYAALVEENGNYYISYRTESASGKTLCKLAAGRKDAEQTQIVCLGGGFILLNDAGATHLWNVPANSCTIIPTKTKVVSISALRADQQSPEKKRFALTAASDGGYVRPQLQLWQYSF